MTDLISVSEAARLANVTPLTIRRRIYEGQLAQYRRGTNRKDALVSKAELEKLMQPRRIEVNKAAAVAA